MIPAVPEDDNSLSHEQLKGAGRGAPGSWAYKVLRSQARYDKQLVYIC